TLSRGLGRLLSRRLGGGGLGRFCGVGRLLRWCGGCGRLRLLRRSLPRLLLGGSLLARWWSLLGRRLLGRGRPFLGGGLHGPRGPTLLLASPPRRGRRGRGR